MNDDTGFRSLNDYRVLHTSPHFCKVNPLHFLLLYCACGQSAKPPDVPAVLVAVFFKSFFLDDSSK